MFLKWLHLVVVFFRFTLSSFVNSPRKEWVKRGRRDWGKEGRLSASLELCVI